jgi:dTDP-4-dehydrorhamnose 3,5-epimerase
VIIQATPISGVFTVDTTPFGDHRGAFARFFCQTELTAVIGSRTILQINHSRTGSTGAIRGLHFQHTPHAEMKLIRCLKGRVWDVAVDLRYNSPTFLQWHAEELSHENMRMMVIPEGCAHGFQVLEPDSELLYLHTAMYHKASEGAVRYNDRQLSIPWPLPLTDISERDQNHPLLTASFGGIFLPTADGQPPTV